MSQTVNAVVKNGHVELLEPLNLPDGTPVKIVVGDRDVASVDPLASLAEIAEDIGPPDLATHLDEYLYGSPEHGR